MDQERIRETAKKLLKKNGIAYSELASSLQLSLAGVKRMMSKGDLPLSRLERIAKLCGLTLFELMEIARRDDPKPYQFTKSQEAALVRQPEALYLFLMLGAAVPLEECVRRAGFTKKQVEKLIFLLDKINLIALMPDGQLRTPIRGPYKWIKNGEMQRKFQTRFLSQIAQMLQTPPTEKELQLTYELYMSESLLKRMKEDLSTLLQKYSSLTRIEHELHPADKIFPVSGALIAKLSDSWGKTLL